MEENYILIASKKQSVVHFLTKNFKLSSGTGNFSSRTEATNIIDKNHNERYKHLRWRENPAIWIRILSIDDKRGMGFAIHIKCKVDQWVVGNSNSSEEYYKKWGFPSNNNGYHFRIAHGNELIFSIVGKQVEKFDPSEAYFLEYLNHTFNLFQENLKLSLLNKKTKKTSETRLKREKNIEVIAEEKEDFNFQSEIQKEVFNIKYNSNELVYESKPKKSKKKSTVSAYGRDASVSARSLLLANYKCEINSNHETFTSYFNKENYVEAHHLIPMSFSEDFEMSLDVEANIVALCPNCHRKIHHGLNHDILELLDILYNNRKDLLASCELKISLNKLSIYYRKYR